MGKRIFLLVLSLIFLLGCSVRFKTASLKDKDFPDQILSDFKYISSGLSGVKEWELRASIAKSYNRQKEIILENISIKFFNPDGKLVSFLSANKGYINTETMNVYGEGNVKIFSEGKVLLETRKIYWNNTAKKFYSESNEVVYLWRNNSYVKGYNMVADIELKEVKMDYVESKIEE